jgi:para-aminobenzoate synthetase/4-amino-4-deoxychorismate lyase
VVRVNTDPPDPALGVFETLLARDGRIQALAAHLQRLAKSVAALYGAPLAPGLDQDLRRAAGHGERRLRVDVRPSAGGLQTEITTSPLSGDRRQPVSCRPIQLPGGLGHHKWADRRRLGGADAYSTAVIVDGEDEVLEGAWANLWLIEGTRLITPPADGRLLPGVTRALLLKAASSLGFDARQEPISLRRAGAAETMFLTSSLRHAVPAAFSLTPPRPDAAVKRIAGTLEARQWE